MNSTTDRKPTILVVEDEPLVRMCTVAFLEDAGYCVLEAANGEDALTALQSHDEIAVLMTDVDMPGKVDGLALAHRAHLDHPAIRSIVVSGKAKLCDALIPGDGRFFSKPYSVQTITNAVSELLLTGRKLVSPDRWPSALASERP